MHSAASFFALVSLSLLCLSAPLSAFEALPFMQIDVHFYTRLAQCQAHCAEKFGSVPGRAQSHDGRSRPSLAWNSPNVDLCQIGCMDADTPSSAGADPPFTEGQQFFRRSTATATPTAQHQQRSIVRRVRPLCAERTENGTPHEKYEAVLALDLAEGQHRGPVRFVVQWRRRPKATAEEPKWITASIESSRTFRVTGLRAGHLHQFSAQPISASGALSAPVLSPWIDFVAIAEGTFPSDSLQFFSRYNAEHGVAALVRWRSSGQKPVLSRRLRRHFLRHFSPPPILDDGGPQHVQELRAVSEYHSDESAELDGSEDWQRPVLAFPTCALQIEWANKSNKAAEQFELDGSDGFLLPHLAFNSDYTVRLLSRLEGKNVRPLLEGTFLSMHCSQVFGPGSLECEPEPIRRLEVTPFADNGSALVSWQMPEASANILLYEVEIEPTQEKGEACAVKPSARIVHAQSNSLLIPLPADTVCEYKIRVTVYDLLGQDASAQLSFPFVPAGSFARSSPFSTTLSALSNLDGSILALLCVIVLVPLAALITLVCTFCRQGTARKARPEQLPGDAVAEKRRRKEQKRRKMAERQHQKQQQQMDAGCNSPHSTGTTESSIAGHTTATTATVSGSDSDGARRWRKGEEGCGRNKTEVIITIGDI